MTLEEIVTQLRSKAGYARSRRGKYTQKTAEKQRIAVGEMLNQVLLQFASAPGSSDMSYPIKTVQDISECFSLYYPVDHTMPRLTPADVIVLHQKIDASLDMLEAHYRILTGAATREDFQVGKYTWLPEEKTERLQLSVVAGSAPPEEISEVLAEISRLYRKAGGSGVSFRFEDAAISEEEFA